MLDPIRAARLSPSAFARYATGGWYQVPRHLAKLERLLVEVAAGRKKRVLISIPPRHGKSELCSKFFVAWFLGLFPDKRVILVSYESDFAAQWGRAVRDLLTEHGWIFGVKVRQDSHAANRWDIVGRRGGMQTSGADGAVMGKGADLLIYDDPHKQWKEVLSDVTREGVYENFQSSARTRLEPGGAIVVLQQRWHERDLMGQLLDLFAKGLESWEHFNFPALAERNDILGRRPGEALWPERYSADALNAHRVTVLEKFWAAQFQQHPSPLEGGLFRRGDEARYELLVEPGQDPLDGTYEIDDGSEIVRLGDMMRFLTVDTATSKKTSADHTAVAAWGVTPRGKLVLLDLDMRRIEGVEVLEAIRRACDYWRCCAYVEDNATSKHLISFLESEGVNFTTVNPGAQDKWTRASLHAAVMWERSNIAIPRRTDGHEFRHDFLAAFERQVFRFSIDSDDDDDSVDCLSYAARIVVEELTAGEGLPLMPSLGARSSVTPAGFGLNRPKGFR